jgi:hypothetical protein
MTAQGWHRDPYGRHDDRWFSGGEPTRLVRDQGAESYDEPPPWQPPLYPLVQAEAPREPSPYYRPRPAGEMLWPEPKHPVWRWWTVCVPGVLALAVSGFLVVAAGLAAVMGQLMDNCNDTCGDPAPSSEPQVVALQELILFVMVLALFTFGMAVPARRRVFALALWAAIALAIGLLPLNAALLRPLSNRR